MDQGNFCQIDIVQRTWPKFLSGISWYWNLPSIILKFTTLTFYFHGFYLHEFGKNNNPWGFILLINQKFVEQSGFVVIINFVKIFI